MKKQCIVSALALASLAAALVSSTGYADDRTPPRRPKCVRMDPTIQLEDYLMPELDGQFTPLMVAYSDYIEDLGWEQTQNPTACVYKAEQLKPTLAKMGMLWRLRK